MMCSAGSEGVISVYRPQDRLQVPSHIKLEALHHVSCLKPVYKDSTGIRYPATNTAVQVMLGLQTIQLSPETRVQGVDQSDTATTGARVLLLFHLRADIGALCSLALTMALLVSTSTLHRLIETLKTSAGRCVHCHIQ